MVILSADTTSVRKWTNINHTDRSSNTPPLSLQPHIPSLLTEVFARLAFLIATELINLTLGFVIT